MSKSSESRNALPVGVSSTISPSSWSMPNVFHMQLRYWEALFLCMVGYSPRMNSMTAARVGWFLDTKSTVFKIVPTGSGMGLIPLSRRAAGGKISILSESMSASDSSGGGVSPPPIVSHKNHTNAPRRANCSGVPSVGPSTSVRQSKMRAFNSVIALAREVFGDPRCPPNIALPTARRCLSLVTLL